MRMSQSRRSPSVVPPLGWLLLLVLAPVLASAQAPQEQATPRPITVPDMAAWKRISATTLSDNGAWFAYRLNPAEGDGEVVVRSTSDTTEYRFPTGEGGGALAFSRDSRWVAFIVNPTQQENQRARAQRRTLRTKVAWVNLATGQKKEMEDVRSFAFSGRRGGWLALSRFPAGAAGGGGGQGAAGGGAPQPPQPGQAQGAGAQGASDRPRGADLVLHELATGVEINLGNVADFAFDDSGRWLAWVVDAEGKVGNGVLLRDMETGVIRVLDNDKARYSNLAWAERQPALVVLKAVDHEDWEAPLHAVLGWTGFGTAGGPVKVVYDPAQDPSFPGGMTISPNRAPRWSEALDALFFGIHEVKPSKAARERAETEARGDTARAGEGRGAGVTPGAGVPRVPDSIPADEKPNLVIWHWKDPRLQRMQELQAQRDRNFSYLSVFWPRENRFVRLADDVVDDVTPADKGFWAIGRDATPYELQGNLDGRRFQDVYVVNMRTGERNLILRQNRWSFDISPDGTHFLYYQDGHFYTYEFATGRHRNITANVPTSFIDTEDDHNVVDPPVRPRGWTEDGRYVLLSDNWDIWRVAVQGDPGLNLTQNGKRDQIRYQALVQFDPDNRPGYDLSKPVYFRTYGEWTKKSGYSLMSRGRPGPEVLVFEDRAYSGFLKARDAEVYLVSWTTVRDYPDWHVTDARLANPRRITDGFPEQKNFLWSAGARLVDYTSAQGDRLQAALLLPANYEPGKSYPTIVYIYEKLSQNLHNYTFPAPGGFNAAFYTSHGYAVLMPDIVYRVNDPGMSAVWCVLPALEAAIATGVVDRSRVGLHGHSWGGYQSSFLATQTDAFAAIATGAPLTNMISMYSSIYWNSGSVNGAIFESSQGRFSGGPWELVEAYTRNSPVYHATKVKTPILLLHNDQDGAVVWNQGIEFYNTLRRLGKPIVMLQYVGENHGVTRAPNRKDYTVRMKEFFDHFLKGEPAPGWWTEGVPHLKMEDHLKERIHLVRPPEAVAAGRGGGH